MFQSITLNIGLDSAKEDWDNVAKVYPRLDGWLAEADWPYWYGREGDARYITASAEPSGLIFCGNIEPRLFLAWVSVLCAKLTLALGREVHDAEM
jgi:hypothetical protein